MSDPTPPQTEETQGEALAAEYVLGLLTRAEQDSFEARLVRDTDLQQDVAAWSEYLVTFSENLPQRQPGAALLPRIEAVAFGAPRRTVWQMLRPFVIGAVLGTALLWLSLHFGLLIQIPGDGAQ